MSTCHTLKLKQIVVCCLDVFNIAYKLYLIILTIKYKITLLKMEYT